MTRSFTEIAQHGYLMTFIWVAAEQMGLPLPSAPILIAAGMLSAAGELSLANALALGVLARVIGDITWYSIGKKFGTAVLRIFCKVSFEPETCFRRGSDFIARHGNQTLLIAKFIPGVNAVAVPLAATSGASVWSFLAFDILGSLLYVGAYLALGRIVGDSVARMRYAELLARHIYFLVVPLGTGALLAACFQHHRKLRRVFEASGITSEEMPTSQQHRDNPLVIELRHDSARS